eukprot:Amastigsp_a10941_40.p3 type:complete len:121 gc:universal Amastigsp_a10941_40:601-239(-)
MSVARIHLTMMRRTSRYDDGGRYRKMLDSGDDRIAKPCEQWWFSRHETSLYTIASGVCAFTWYALFKPWWSRSWHSPATKVENFSSVVRKGETDSRLQKSVYIIWLTLNACQTLWNGTSL